MLGKASVLQKYHFSNFQAFWRVGLDPLTDPLKMVVAYIA